MALRTNFSNKASLVKVYKKGGHKNYKRLVKTELRRERGCGDRKKGN